MTVGASIIGNQGESIMNDQTPARRLTAADFDQDLLDLYDYYAHGKISKREKEQCAQEWGELIILKLRVCFEISHNIRLCVHLIMKYIQFKYYDISNKYMSSYASTHDVIVISWEFQIE